MYRNIKKKKKKMFIKNDNANIKKFFYSVTYNTEYISSI